MNQADGEAQRRRHADRTRANLDHTRIAVHEERWEGHRREHDAEFRALNEARMVIDARLADMNELRRQIDRERADYVQQSVLDAQLKGLLAAAEETHKTQNGRLAVLEQWRANMTGRLTVTAAGLGLFMTIMVFVANYLTRR